MNSIIQTDIKFRNSIFTRLKFDLNCLLWLFWDKSKILNYDQTMCNYFRMFGYRWDDRELNRDQTSGQHNWIIAVDSVFKAGMGKTALGKGDIWFPGKKPPLLLCPARSCHYAVPWCNQSFLLAHYCRFLWEHHHCPCHNRIDPSMVEKKQKSFQ